MRIVKLDEASMKNILADMLKRDPNNYELFLIIQRNLIKQRSMQTTSV